MPNDDDILGDDFFESTMEDDDKSSTSTEDPEIEAAAELEYPSNFPKLVGTNFTTEFKDIVSRFLMVYEGLPRLDYNQLHEEVAGLAVPSRPTPTLQLINLQLQKVQANKDRLAEIYVDVVRSFAVKKRLVNVLNEAYGKFAEGKSADKRKSDCAFRISDFHRDFAETEGLYVACEHVLKTLDSAGNTLSRQITIIQSQLKLFDMGRGSLPDFDFNNSSLNEGFESLGDNFASASEQSAIVVDESESKKAEEHTF